MSAMIDPLVERAIRDVDAGMAIEVPEAERQALARASGRDDDHPIDPRDVEFVDVEDDQ